MNANYSEALEQQIKLSGWLGKPDGSAWLKEEYPTPLDITVVDSLRVGETFYIAPEIGAVLSAAAVSLRDKKFTLSQQLPPSEWGFCWLGSPFGLAENAADNSQARLVAFSWGICHTCNVDDHPDVAASHKPSYWREDEKEYRRGVMIVPWIQWPDWRAPRPAVPAIWPFETDIGAILGSAIAEFQSAAVLDRLARYVATLWTFMQQKILASPVRQAERHVRKRAERGGWQAEPIIRVIELRRREILAKHAVEQVEQEWSCQWIVRGHWRQQPYPKAGDVKPLWITPYVKGPEDKPLKPPRATVFAVVR